MYKQLKIDMRQAPLLNSHITHTAAQEVASLVLAHALIAQTRMQAAGVAGELGVSVEWHEVQASLGGPTLTPEPTPTRRSSGG